MIRRAGLLLAAGLALASLSFSQTVSSISPNSAPAGSGPVSVVINGQFPVGTVLSVQWFVPGTDSATQLNIVDTSAGKIFVTVPASLLTQPESAEIYVDNNYTSYAIFTVTGATPPTLSSLSPSSAVEGSPTLSLTVNGANFPAGVSVTWNGSPLQTSYNNAALLTATVPASLLVSPGSASVSLNTQPAPAPLMFTITSPPLLLSSISPNNIVAGSSGFTLTVNGSNFTNATSVTWNGSPLGTAFVSSTQLNATVPANLVATAGTASVDVAASGQTAPPALTFTINPALTLTSVSPTSAVAGGPAFTLTINGTGFTAQAIAYWNSTSLSTSLVNANQLTANVPASLIAQAGSASIAVQSSAGSSNALPFSITAAPLTLSSISPNTAVAGSAAFTLTANGSGFTNNTVVNWNGSALSTTFVSATQLTAAVPANLIATAGTASVGVSAPNQTSPSPLSFTITSNLTISNISPTSATAGGPAFTLTVNGAGFNSGTMVYWNSTALSSTPVGSGQLLAAVPASLITQPGTDSITARNGSLTSNAVNFTVTATTPTLTSLSPNSAVAGGAAFTLTANGSGFTSGSQVTWNGSPLSTTFISAAQLSVTVPANLIATTGTASVGVSVPGLTSPAPLSFSITPNLTLTSLAPSSIAAGGAAFNLTVSGTGFAAGTGIFWNGLALSTTVLNANTMTALVPANLIAQQGSAAITAQNGNAVSNALTFSITGAQGTITLISLSPNSAPAGSPALTLTVNGSGFTASGLASGTTVTWNGSPLATTFVSATQLTALVPATLLATAGTAAVSVTGQPYPASLPFTISNGQSLTLTSVSPSTVAAGGPAFTLTLNGTGFNNATSVTWNGNPLATTFVSATQLTASVPATLIASGATVAIDVSVIAGQTAPPALQLVITQGLTLTSLSPSSATAGGAAFTLTVTGTGFAAGATVLWNGSTPLATTFVNATQLTAAVSASLIAQSGSATVTVSSGSLVSNALTFTIAAAGPAITSISPASVVAGGAALTLTVNGSGFVSGAVVALNGTPLTTAFVSGTQVTAAIPATLTAQPGSAKITLTNPSGAASNAVTLTITAAPPVITSISPASVMAAGAAFTLTVNGTGFVSGGVVSLNGTALTTTFVSGTQVTAGVPAAFIAQLGTAQITFANPGGPVSNAVALTITAAPPVITSISPISVVAGGPAFTLTVTGTGFVTGATVSFNSTALTTTFVSATQLTAAVPANLITLAGTAQISAANSGGPASNAVGLTITPATPTISSISPSTTPVGGIAFTITVTGTNFLAGAIVSLNGTALNTTFVSATQLTAVVPANLITQPGTATITVANIGGAASNAVSLTIRAPVPTLTSISPNSVTQGGPAFTLTVNGTNFVSGATASLGSTSLTTTFVSSTQLTAAVPASLILQAGPLPVTVTNPGTAASNPLPLTVAPPTPTITSISPTSVTAGGPAFTLTVTGTGFLAGAVVLVNNGSLNTTVVSATQLTAQVPPNLIAQAGTLQVTTANPPGAQSNTVTLTVSPVAPTVTSISPASANVGDPSFTLSLTGTGFVQASIVMWNGAPLGTTFVSATQLTATVDAGRLILPGTASVTVVAAGQTSNAVTFTINPVTPVISSLSPNSITAGSGAFSLTLNGSGLTNLTTVQWNTTALTTHFVSATQVTADVPATLVAQAGTVTVTAVNPGNSVSAGITFTINAPTPPAITSLSQTSATAGSAALTLTVTGTGFASGAVVNFGSTALTTAFVSATQLTAAVPANLLVSPTTYQVVVQQGGTSSNAETFTVNLPAPPSLTLTPPATSLPAQQPNIGFALNAAYPLALSGTVTLTFASNATVPVDDPSIQFASGGRTFTFTVPANTTTLPALLIQTGTVAGVITLKVTLTAAGVDVTPATGSSATITIAKSAPVIRTVTLIHANGYLEVDINGFSTTRDMTTAVFTLNAAPGGSFTSSVITVPVSTLFTGWYQSSGSTAFGSQFTYAQPFTVIGDTNQIQSVTVTLTNSTGTSSSATSN